MVGKKIELVSEDLEYAEEVLNEIFTGSNEIDWANEDRNGWIRKELQDQSQTFSKINQAVKSLNESIIQINQNITHMMKTSNDR